jgi:hypothetical protein
VPAEVLCATHSGRKWCVDVDEGYTLPSVLLLVMRVVQVRVQLLLLVVRVVWVQVLLVQVWLLMQMQMQMQMQMRVLCDRIRALLEWSVGYLACGLFMSEGIRMLMKWGLGCLMLVALEWRLHRRLKRLLERWMVDLLALWEQRSRKLLVLVLVVLGLLVGLPAFRF